MEKTRPDHRVEGFLKDLKEWLYHNCGGEYHINSVHASDYEAEKIRQGDPDAIFGLYVQITQYQQAPDARIGQSLRALREGDKWNKLATFAGIDELLEEGKCCPAVASERELYEITKKWRKSGGEVLAPDHDHEGICPPKFFIESFNRSVSLGLIPLRLYLRCRDKHDGSLLRLFEDAFLAPTPEERAGRLLENLQVKQAKGVVGWFLSILFHPSIDPELTVHPWRDRSVYYNHSGWVKDQETYNQNMLNALRKRWQNDSLQFEYLYEQCQEDEAFGPRMLNYALFAFGNKGARIDTALAGERADCFIDLEKGQCRFEKLKGVCPFAEKMCRRVRPDRFES